MVVLNQVSFLIPFIEIYEESNVLQVELLKFLSSPTAVELMTFQKYWKLSIMTTVCSVQ